MSEKQNSVTPRLVEQIVVTDFIDSIICGDNCDVLRRIPDECIDLVVTSPPYDELRTYGGHSWDFYGVAWNLKRILKSGGVIVWVVNDATVNGSETCTSFQQAMHFRSLGLNLHDTMIYKTNKPPMNDGRYQQCFEYMFILSKGKPQKTSLIMEKSLHPGVKHSGGMRNKDGVMQERSICNRTPETKIKENIWYLPRSSKTMDSEAHKHPATFPDHLATDHIATWSEPGDLVLDPFAGSGTTCLAAKELGRHWIGVEVNPDYVEIANKRMAQEVLCL